jgi:hypothetical protein
MGGRLVVGGFAWILALGLGATLIDSIYARAIREMGEAEIFAGVFNEIGDLLQLPLVLTIAAGFGALAVTKRQPPALGLVIAGLFFIVVPLLLVLTFGSQIEAAGMDNWLRLGSAAVAAVCAMIAALVFTPS